MPILAVPVALPLVLQVTMALGAGKMATEFNAVVTSLPALQDISSMSVLCSDKTGTLTTANISIHKESVYTSEGFTSSDLALYGCLASNRDKKEDPIDRSVIKHFDDIFGAEKGAQMCAEYTKVRIVGFNPIYKRVVAEFTHPSKGKVIIAKGLPAKVIDTADGGVDDAADQWTVQNLEQIKPIVSTTDLGFSEAGYKTLGVSVKINNEPWKFVGILPMLDPPRHDSALTVANLQAAGISVKMITGDHLNIGIETARLIGMGTNMHHGVATRDGTEQTKELIKSSDGFAQVLPKDKREVVMVLKNHFQNVVGMTGDGVNDAPALSAAQCGIAVDDATDAAKNAAAIILTTPGLSAIYSAVVESRRIFRKLKAYVTYRFAATIQIVLVLSLLIFISNCPIDSLFVILLALFNDITMLPIAYDHQLASKTPETPDVYNMLLLSFMLGMLETAFSMAFAYGASLTGWFSSYDDDWDLGSCDTTIQAAVWLQMSIAAELLIFSARAPSYMWTSILPSASLFWSVIMGCIVTSVLAGVFDMFGGLKLRDILIIWAYDIVGLVILDICKVQFLSAFNESLEVLDDDAGISSAADDAAAGRDGSASGRSSYAGALMSAAAEDDDLRMSRVDRLSQRLSQWDQLGRNSSATGASVSYNYNQSYNEHSMRSHTLKSGDSGASSGYHSASRGKSSRSPSKVARELPRNSLTGRPTVADGRSIRPRTPANEVLR